MKKKKSRAARAFPNTPVPAGRALTDKRKRKRKRRRSATPITDPSRNMRKRLAFLDVETHSLKDVRLKSKIRSVVEVETGELIALICKASSERWPEDLSRPGIQIAHLPAEPPAQISVKTPEQALGALALGAKHGEDIPGTGKVAAFYVALHRYTGYQAVGRIVAFKTTADDLDKALHEVAVYVATPTPMRAELAKVLK